MAHDRYISPFSTRYASDEMQFIFSEDHKFRTWRRLWIALAEAEAELGLPISEEQIEELTEKVEEDRKTIAAQEEKIASIKKSVS